MLVSHFLINQIVVVVVAAVGMVAVGIVAVPGYTFEECLSCALKKVK